MSERPTVPGFYWYKDKENGKLEIAVVAEADGRLYVTGLSTLGLYSKGSLVFWNGQWAGPIEEPKEA